jgi:hypothetical protein
MYCKRVRDDTDYWQQVETYIQEFTGSSFSHGICPECFKRQMGNIQQRTGIKIAPQQQEGLVPPQL